MRPIAHPLRLALPAVLLASLAACGSDSGGGSDFSLHTTTQAAEPSAPIVVVGDWIVYLASEAFTGPAGTDLNSDGDTIDRVAFAVNNRSRTETNLEAAALGAAVLGDEIYLVVEESLDGVDWNGGGIGDTVLLHWSATAAALTFVDTLELGFAGELPLAVDGRLYYAASAPTPGVDETNLRMLDAAAPTTPVVVLNEAGAGALTVHLHGEEQGLVFLSSDEADGGLDQNNDADATDTNVLALLDGTDPLARVKSVKLALAGDSAPFAARSIGTGDWIAAFLVDETAQGATNLNDQALFSQPLLPEHCSLTPDLDTTDEVLHTLEFAGFVAGSSQPVNTGLAGHDRVLIVIQGTRRFAATISPEADANCNLNQDAGGTGTADADTSDEVARWVEITTPIAPARSAEDLHALATDVGGGSLGLAVLDERLIGVIDEAEDDKDNDGKANDHDLVAWLDPVAANPTWDFTHQHPSNRAFGTGVFDSDGDSEPFAGTTWMAAEAVSGRLGLVFLEAVPGTNSDVGSLNTNLDCALVVKDTDKVDGLPVWADFESGPTLDFDGMGYAVDPANAGIEIAAGFAFFRVSEAADNRDYNADGNKDDVVLFRNPLTTCGPVPMATSSLVPSQAVTTDRLAGAAFLSSETQAGQDFNGDGDQTDLVVRYFRF